MTPNGWGPHLISAEVDAVLDRVFAVFAAAVFVIAAILVFVLTLQQIFAY